MLTAVLLLPPAAGDAGAADVAMHCCWPAATRMWTGRATAAAFKLRSYASGAARDLSTLKGATALPRTHSCFEAAAVAALSAQWKLRRCLRPDHGQLCMQQSEGVTILKG